MHPRNKTNPDYFNKFDGRRAAQALIVVILVLFAFGRSALDEVLGGDNNYKSTKRIAGMVRDELCQPFIAPADVGGRPQEHPQDEKEDAEAVFV